MRNLNPSENSSILLGSIMGVTSGQAKIIADLPPEAQQPAIDMCKGAERGDAMWSTFPYIKTNHVLELGGEKAYTNTIWLNAHEGVTKKLANT